MPPVPALGLGAVVDHVERDEPAILERSEPGDVKLTRRECLRIDPEFALRRALDEEAETRMREAYRRQPDDAEPAYFDVAAWESAPVLRRRGRPR